MVFFRFNYMVDEFNGKSSHRPFLEVAKPLHIFFGDSGKSAAIQIDYRFDLRMEKVAVGESAGVGVAGAKFD